MSLVSKDPFPIVIEAFTPRIDEVRESALRSGFGTWKPSKGEVGSSNYDGMNFWGAHAIMTHALSRHIGRPVYPNSMFFRVTNEDTESAYVHSDRESGDYTAIVYLSQHTGEYRSGTGFFKHRETGQTHMKPVAEASRDPNWDKFADQMVRGSPEDWELLRAVQGKYNRAVIFDAPRFHARFPKSGIGTTAEDGRMVWVCHFMTEINS